MKLKINTLCENTAVFGYLAEWGLSMHVKTESFSFLLDTGMTDVAVRNANRTNIDFTRLNAIVLSHGHLDHTGGLSHVLSRTGPIDVYAHPDIFAPKFSARHQPPDEDISMPFTEKSLSEMGARLHLLNQPVQIAPAIFVSGEVPMKTSFEKTDHSLLTQVNGKHVKDPLNDDLSMAVQTEKGLFILLGCAHRGIVNIIQHLQQITGEKRVYAIAGGLHLSRASDAHLREVTEFFREIDVQKIACSHCTGFDATAYLKNAFPERFIHNHSGTRLVFN